MVVALDLYPLLVVDPFCDLDEEYVGLDVGYLFCCIGYGVGCLECLGTGVGFLDFLGSSMEDLVVVKFFLHNF